MLILADEVYDRLCFDSHFPRCALAGPEAWNHTVTIGSIGKSFNATGWRMGFAIGLGFYRAFVRRFRPCIGSSDRRFFKSPRERLLGYE